MQDPGCRFAPLTMLDESSLSSRYWMNVRFAHDTGFRMLDTGLIKGWSAFYPCS
ncbi:MAG: hypothetical protein M0Q38_13940 [Bacteroidales bacterium]|nr:hypothetical protein [Bacteroidales bacterium]